MAKVKLQITMDEDLLADVDDYCDKNYMNRSWLITQAVNQVINQQKVIDALCDISIAIKKVSDTGVLDEETEKQLADFETVVKMFVQK